jgi:hypothetical protein
MDTSKRDGFARDMGPAGESALIGVVKTKPCLVLAFPDQDVFDQDKDPDELVEIKIDVYSKELDVESKTGRHALVRWLQSLIATLEDDNTGLPGGF